MTTNTIVGFELAAPEFNRHGERQYRVLARFPDGRDETLLEIGPGGGAVSRHELSQYFIELLRNLRDVNLIGNAGPETKPANGGEDGRIVDCEPFGR